jgi:hypothetical protein
LSEVKEPYYRTFATILRDGGLTDAAGKALRFDDDEVMWNSGVIGINAADSATLEDAVALVDQFKAHPASGGIHQIEQFATGYFLRHRTRLRGASDIVYHYWYHDLKDPFRPQLPGLVAHRPGDTIRWSGPLRAARPRTSAVRKMKMAVRITLRALGLRVPGIRGSL